MSLSYYDPWDVQLRPAAAVCAACGGEIYRYDPAVDVFGRLYHDACVPPEYAELFPTYPACHYFEGGRETIR